VSMLVGTSDSTKLTESLPFKIFARMALKMVSGTGNRMAGKAGEGREALGNSIRSCGRSRCQ
jgi:hypothetical protein